MPSTQSNPRVFVIGDSISMQYHPYLEKFLEGRFQYSRKTGETAAALNLDIPTGANGGDSGMVVQFLLALQRAGGLAADWLLVNCGLHDIKRNPVTGVRQVPAEQYPENLRQIVALAKAMKLKLVWINTTPADEAVHNAKSKEFHRFAADVVECNHVAAEVMGAAGVPMIDLFTFTTRLGPDLYCDHVHFHDAVREKQASFIAGWLMGHIH